MKAPQIIMIVLFAMDIGFVISQHGKPSKPINAWSSLIAAVIQIGLLIWGGFFG